MNQKNANKVWKCSGRQTLPFGIIVQHNKNTFVWCQIKRTKMPFYGILEILQNMTYKNLKPIYLGSFYSIMNCGTISMGTKINSMCKIIKGTKTPIRYLMDK